MLERNQSIAEHGVYSGILTHPTYTFYLYIFYLSGLDGCGGNNVIESVVHYIIMCV